MDSQQVKQLIKESSGLSDLEGRLAQKGHQFKSNKQLARFVYRAWQEANADQIKRIQTQPVVEIRDLPYSEVRRDGTIYRIHGIVHGEPWAGMNLSPNTKDFISSRVKGYRNLPEEDYVLEGGFAGMFGLDESREMHDYHMAFKRVGQKRAIQITLSALIKLPLRYFHARISPGAKSNPLSSAILNSLEKPSYLSKARSLYPLFILPDPVDLELRLATGNDFSVYRSEEMAKFMLNYAREKSTKVLHGVVGLDHESQICHYLRTLNLRTLRIQALQSQLADAFRRL